MSLIGQTWYSRSGNRSASWEISHSWRRKTYLVTLRTGTRVSASQRTRKVDTLVEARAICRKWAGRTRG